MSDHTRLNAKDKYRDELKREGIGGLGRLVRMGAFGRGWDAAVAALEAENARLRAAVQSSLQIIRVAWSNQECAEARAILQAALSPATEEPKP